MAASGEFIGNAGLTRSLSALPLFIKILAMIKLIVVLAFLAIIASLGSALYHLVRHKELSEHTVKALSLRIGISVGLFILLFIAYATGIIKPHGIAANMAMQRQAGKATTDNTSTDTAKAPSNATP